MTCRFYTLCALTCIALHLGCVEPPPVAQRSQDMDEEPPIMEDMPTLDISSPADMGVPDADMPTSDDPRCARATVPEGERFHAGTGVSGDPFLICVRNSLALIGAEESDRFMSDEAPGHYILGKDIDLSSRAWVPIPCFRGILDGAGHTIANLHITSGGAVSSCAETQSPYHGGFITEVLGGTIRALNFQKISHGTADAPLPELYANTQTLHTMGGLFGITRAAQIEDLTVQGLEAHVTGRFGGLVNQSVDSSWTRVSIRDSVITYKRGHVGGFVRHANATTPPGPQFREIDVDVKLVQGVSPKSASVEMFSPFGLFAATTEGAFTLESATVQGGITHRYTPEESVMMFGGIVGQTIDQRLSSDQSNEAKNLRELNTSLKDILVYQMSMEECQAAPSPCGETGAIFGRLGTETTMSEFDVTPVDLRDVEIANVLIQGHHSALVVGHHVDGSLNMLRVSIHQNLVSRTASAPANLCLIALESSGLAHKVEGLCLDTNTCKDQNVIKQCMTESFSTTAWQQGVTPPQLER